MSFGRQVVHVFVGDVRRFWPALLALAAAIAFHRIEGLPMRRIWSLGVPDGLDVFPLLYAAITVLVVQHHSVIDDRSFWNVRPITRGAILTSKLAFIGLFLCVVPVAIQIQWLVALAGGGDLWPATADSLLYQGALLALVALGAAVTRNVADFLTLALVAWVGTGVITSLGEGPFFRLMADDVLASRAYVLRWAWLTIAIGLLVMHYRIPRAVPTLVVGMLVLLGATAVIQTRWIDLIRSPLEPAELTAYTSAERIGLRVSSLSANSRSTPGEEVRAGVAAGLVADGTGGATIFLGRSTSTLVSPRRTVVLLHPSPATRFSGLGGPRWLDVLNGRVRIDGAVHVGSVGERPERMLLAAPLAEGPVHEIEALRDVRSISLEVGFDVFEPRLSTKLPDAPSKLGFRGGVLTIERIDRAPGSVRVAAVFRRVSRALSSRFRQEFFVTPGSDIVLFNRERREYMLGAQLPDRALEYRGPESYLVPGSSLHEQRLGVVFDARGPAGVEDPPIPDEWFQGAELYLVEPGYAGSFSRRLEREVDAWPELDGPSVPVDPAPR